MGTAEGLRESVEEAKCFIRGVIKNAREVGAPLPTSRFAARAMCEPVFSGLAKSSRPSVLEVGAGTGSISRFLIDVVDQLESLIICECNKIYADFLHKTLSSRSTFKNSFQTKAVIINDYVENIEARLKTKGMYHLLQKRFDFIVCSLPFLSFSPAKCRDLLHVLKSLSHERTIMTFYEHLGFRELKEMFAKERRSLYRDIERVTVRNRVVYWNYYPIKVVWIRPFFLDFYK